MSAGRPPSLSKGAVLEPPHCHYFEAGRCRSCTLIETPYEEQLRAKQERCRALLGAFAPEEAWLDPVSAGVRDFRNKAKLVVGGRSGRVTLGILDGEGAGVDLRDCLIHEPGIRDAIPRIASFLDATGLAPYDVPRRRGELKFVHVTSAPSGADVVQAASLPDTASGIGEAPSGAEVIRAASLPDTANGIGEAPNGALMLRFVVRGEHGLARLRKRLGELRRAVPEAAVISVNLLPEHKAVLEGEREALLRGSALRMDLPVPLHLRPQSFFQTNTEVARALYAQASEWADRVDPASVWDLYCGVGGFALHTARRGRGALGVEISEAAIDSARRSAREAGIPARFVAADATEFALAAAPDEFPELVIVNPPRRGIGAELAGWLERSRIRHAVYSSCNPESLARDLAAMPSLAVREARLFDMFPHTSHLEVAVLLERRA